MATIAIQGSTFALNIALANLLGRQIFGEYSMIQSTVLTAASISQLATGYTATKYIAEFRSTDRERAGRVLGLCSAVSTATAFIATAALFVGAPRLADSVLQAPHLAPGLMIAAGIVFFTVLNGYQMGALAGLESYAALAKAGVISGVLYLGICTVSAELSGLVGVLLGLLASTMLRWHIHSGFLRAESAKHNIAIHYHGLWQERAVLLNFALPAALSGFTTMPSLWLANTFLARQPGGYEQIALYSAANNFRVIVLLLPNILNNVGMSLLNNQKGLGDEERYWKVFWLNTALTAVSVLGGAFIVALSGFWLLGMFGQGFAEGYPVLAILLLSTVPEGLALAVYQVVQSQARLWLSFSMIAAPRDASTALLSFLLSPTYGASGLAIAYAAARTIALFACIVVAWRTSTTMRTAKSTL